MRTYLADAEIDGVPLLYEQGEFAEPQVGDRPTHIALPVEFAEDLYSLERSLRNSRDGSPVRGLSVWTRETLRNLDLLREKRDALIEAAEIEETDGIGVLLTDAEKGMLR